MRGKVPTVDAKAPNLVPARFVKLMLETTGPLEISKTELPLYIKSTRDSLSTYHAERLEKLGREFLEEYVDPDPSRAELQEIPVKAVLPRKWVDRDFSYSAVDEDMYKLTWNLVRLMDSEFRHFDAVRRAFCAPGGLSILNGKNQTGKTTVAVSQALQAALCGHKVLITGPTEADVNAISNRLLDMLTRMDDLAIRDKHKNPKLKVYLATAMWEDVLSMDDLLDELERAHQRAVPESLLTNRVGPHSLFHQLSLDLHDESRRQSGDKNVMRPAFPRSFDTPLIFDAVAKFRKIKSVEAVDILHNSLYRTLTHVLKGANIVVTSCLAAGNIPFFEPTVVIVDQWNSDKDWECMIPLTAFDHTSFRSIIGSFDIPHWRRMWEWGFPITLPVQFSIALDTHQRFTSMYTLNRRMSNGIMDLQSSKRPEKASLLSRLETVDGAADNRASGADVRHQSLDAASKSFDNEPKIAQVTEQDENVQVAETEQTMEAGIDYCTAYMGHWYNE
ncbi:MAG: hypothetical protein Q9195_005595 [Heterodermia aff. obscurata]